MTMTMTSSEHEAPDGDPLEEKMPLDLSDFDRPLITMEEFRANGANVFRSDEEVDDLIAMTLESRRSGMA